MKRNYTFYSDAAHGWMAVHVDEIYVLGIKDEISHYSYILKNTVYLEEDCDAGVFINKAKEIGWDISIKNHPKDRPDIRNFCAYKPELI